MKQLDFETSNYKHKEDLKTFVNSVNDLADKYAKTFANADADLNKITSTIEKKNVAIGKLEAGLLDLNKKIDELDALKRLSNEEIRELNEKKSSISYTDSEVQKMELDDINSQITAKKGKISKIDGKLDATKAKIKSSNEERKTSEKELKDLDKERVLEEEALFKTQSLLKLIEDVKTELNNKALEIVNAPYKPQEPVKQEETVVDKTEELAVENTTQETEQEEQETTITPEDVVLTDVDADLDVLDYTVETKPLEEVTEEIPVTEDDINLDTNEMDSFVKSDKPRDPKEYDEELDDMFRKEGLSLDDFTGVVRENLVANKETVMTNVEILKKHNVPLDKTVDQSEILYAISSQDLDDLLSIITTDDEGNGMGFTIDFTYNILSELAKINVDKLIDVYNSEFMNVNAKSGIIYLLKLTNPDLKEFEKNKRVNIEILKSLGANTVDEIIEKYPDFVNMDNPLFINVLNVFDRSDLVEKLNADVDVIPKIIEYWKNN